MKMKSRRATRKDGNRGRDRGSGRGGDRIKQLERKLKWQRVR